MTDTPTLADRLDQLLPQTQCRQCGYPACRPYAEALAADEADPNQCPPGGETVRAALARALGRPLSPAGPVHPEPRQVVAQIIESACIGCTKCIQVCPTDAIIGAAGLMHSVVAPWCTGCGLCVPVCPTDCIDLPARDAAAPAPRPAVARARYDALHRRRAREGVSAGAGYVEIDDVDRAALLQAVKAAVRRRRDRA